MQPRAGRRDHHPVRLPDAARRSACSRWTSSACATSPSSTTRVENIEANRGRDRGPRGPRRSTTSRPTSCSAAATRSGVFQLDGGPMRALLRLDAAGQRSRTSPPSSRSTGPARWAPNSHTTTPSARTAASRSRRSIPELAEPLAEILGDTYGLIVYQEQVMAIAQKVAGYTLGAGRPAPPRDGQEEEVELDAEYVTFESGHEGARLLPGRRSRRCGTSWSRSPTTRSTRRTPRRTACVSYWTAYLKANYPAEYMAALLTCVRDDKDKSALYLDECRRMGIKVLPPDVNELRRRLHRRRHRHPVRPGRDPQRRRQRRRRRSSAHAQEKGRFRDFADFLRKVRPWSATSGPSSR